MSDFQVVASGGSYGVHIESGSMRTAMAGARVAIVDEALLDRVSGCSAAVISVPGGETTKSLNSCESVLVRMQEAGVKRGDTLVAVGGGVIQDVATFVSSFYMRGIPWVFSPSTAMAMADSCIGGKSSINVGGIKNLGGNFHPPARVVIDPSLAETLGLAARISGLSEAVKICFAAGPESFSGYLDRAVRPEDFGGTVETAALLDHVLRAKKWFVEVDEFDQAERQLLNFGHTFGHALEAATAFAIPHGVAVALGILAALAHPQAARTAQTEALQDYCVALLTPIRSSVSEALVAIDWSKFDRAIETDKKGTHDSVRLVLPGGSSTLQVVPVARTPESLREIRHAMASGVQVAGI